MSAKPQPVYGQRVDDYIVNEYLPWLEETAGARIDALIEQTALEIGAIRAALLVPVEDNVAGVPVPPGEPERTIRETVERFKVADDAAREQARAEADVPVEDRPIEGPD
jgi:hypothetical protein